MVSKLLSFSFFFFHFAFEHFYHWCSSFFVFFFICLELFYPTKIHSWDFHPNKPILFHSFYLRILSFFLLMCPVRDILHSHDFLTLLIFLSCKVLLLILKCNFISAISNSRFVSELLGVLLGISRTYLKTSEI